MATLHGQWTHLALAARLEKNLPMVSLPILGALACGGRVKPIVCVVECFVLVIVLVYCTFLNTFTDRQLDSGSKPEQYEHLRRAGGGLVTATLIAWVLVAVALVWLITEAPLTVLILGGVALFGGLYSFDALRWRAATRWKAHWLTHAISFLACYVLMLELGLVIASAHLAVSTLLFLGVSLSDYGVVIRECAADGDAERRANLRTLAALFTQAWNQRVALAVALLGAACTIAASTFSVRLAVALIPPALVRLAVLRGGAGRWAIDGTFFLGRAFPILVLAVWPGGDA